MTTLPTTSSFRLPRGPGGPTNLPPSPPPGGPVSVAPAFTPADVWRVIRGNLWLIVVTVAVAIAVGFGIYSYLLQTAPKYRSVGMLLIDRPYRINPVNQTPIDGTLTDWNLQIEQRTQQQQILSEVLWSDVLQTNEVVRNSNWFKNFQAIAARTGGGSDPARMAKADLEDNLRVSPITDSKLMQVTMDCSSPDDARDIVEAIGNAHISNQQKRSFDRTSADLESAKQWMNKFNNDAKTTRDKMNSQVGRSVDIGRQTIMEMEMGQLVGAQTKARLEAAAAQGQMEAINGQIKDGKDPYQVEMIVRSDPNVQRLQMRLDEFEFELLRMNSTGEGSTTYKNMVAAKSAARERLDRAEANARAMARSQVLDSTKSDATAKKNEADSIDARLEDLKKNLTEMNSARVEYTSLKDELDDYKLKAREMGERVAVLQNAVRQNSSSVQWSSVPNRPDTLSSPNIRVILPVSIMAGLALSLGIAFLRELADTSVRSPRDITRVGPMNVLGMVARESDDPELTGVPLHSVIATAPQSLLAEQLRQVRTRLQHATSLDTTRTLLVTSPGPNDGKTTIACNLAAGLALNGRRILLVDANFHRPALHKLYNVTNDNGFSNVLESVGNLEAAVKKTPVANLEILTTGPRPSNQTELLESPLFTDFIERALEEYDHVIFDAGPLLVVSEAVALAPRVDGVIVVVRAKQNTRGMLSRVRDTLKQIKAEQIGVVLNGVQTWGGGYYARTIKTYYDYQTKIEQ